MLSPLVSIIIPSYNYGHYLTYALDSALNQHHKNIEVLIIDDGSTDQTKEVALPYLHLACVQYIYQENAGLSAARNKGLSLAKGEFIQFLDADDVLSPDCIATGVRLLQSTPSAPASVCANKLFTHTIDDCSKKVWRWPEGGKIDELLCFRNIAPPHAFLSRKILIDQIGPFDTELKACEDYDFWFRLFCRFGEPIVSDSLVYYRRHTTSMSANLKRQYTYDCIMQEKILQSFEGAVTNNLPFFGENISKAKQYSYALAQISSTALNLRNCSRHGLTEHSPRQRAILKSLTSLINQLDCRGFTSDRALDLYSYHIKRCTKKYAPELKKHLNLPSLSRCWFSKNSTIHHHPLLKCIQADLTWALT